jgi:fluoride exporter
MDRYLAVISGAAVGGLLRYVVASAIIARFPGKFPLGTLAVNITGCFLIGLAMTVLTERVNPHLNWGLFLVTGVLGGYTTFSTFGWETFQAVKQGQPGLGLLNVMLSVLAGYLAVWLGVVLGRK